jgi:hypothetical protein
MFILIVLATVFAHSEMDEAFTAFMSLITAVLGYIAGKNTPEAK